ncbi:bifunctional methylenetetrahydrofolate dehydrogenase/methenyltetrahydrofolate cyclohydrolase [Candidatus Falkowbacteria bacterium]|nr:bifunctional methylenetetrahydrofolate dehydrogenase/methenyltetrahydrofolate cyclohydrolase [Candidatus Falkowbacteria bacterium]
MVREPHHDKINAITMPDKNKILDGKTLSEKIIKKLAKEIKKMPRKPGLAAILIGDDQSSHLYVKLKKQACEKCEINFHYYYFESDCSEEEIIKAINFLNRDDDIYGILIQLPLPEKFHTDNIISAIAPEKDVDGLRPKNLHQPLAAYPTIVSPLVLGIVELIKSTREKIENKKITILCNHKIFGEQFHGFYGADNEIKILTANDANFEQELTSADILIVAIGKPKFITEKMIKKDAIIIDAGINKIDGKVVGDVDFENVLEKVKFISPVPGGVGPMTIAMLLRNLIKLPLK